MNEMINPGALNLTVVVFTLTLLIVGFIAWFFINRASVRANQQIELLEALLDQQKRQNALLRRLCDANEPEREPVTETSMKKESAEEFVRLVAER